MARETSEKPLDAATPAGPVATPRARRVRGQAANDLEVPTSWSALLLVEVSNYAALRRHVGKARAEALAGELAAELAQAASVAQVAVASRSIVEVLLEVPSLAVLESRISELERRFGSWLDVDGEIFPVNLVTAAAAAPHGSTEDVRLSEEAEAALIEAHRERRCVIRDLSVGAPAFDRLSLVRELPNAIASGQMFVQYQPKLHVRHQRIASAEALIRWQHPSRGLILPGDFITAAEEADEIEALTLWTITQVIEDQQRLQAAGHDITIFINISGQLLSDPRFVEAACERVRGHERLIGFEVTETAVIRDPESAIRHLKRFDEIGICIAIDDYGAGLSSLAYLKRLPARELKIDKMFVLQLTSSNRDPLIVRSTIDLAHALDMEVTAEGVESPAAMALLSVMGCDIIQGYLLSRPLGFAAFLQFLSLDPAHSMSSEAGRTFHRPPSFWISA